MNVELGHSCGEGFAYGQAFQLLLRKGLDLGGGGLDQGPAAAALGQPILHQPSVANLLASGLVTLPQLILGGRRKSLPQPWRLLVGSSASGQIDKVSRLGRA